MLDGGCRISDVGCGMWAFPISYFLPNQTLTDLSDGVRFPPPFSIFYFLFPISYFLFPH